MTPWTAADKESVDIAQRAIEDMKKAGAEVIDLNVELDKALVVLLPQLVYPMKTIPAGATGARTAPAPAAAGYRPSSGNVLSSQTGFPSIIMPAGFTTTVYDWVPDPAESSRTIPGNAVPARVPVGMEFLGVPFSEPVLLKIVSGYENITRPRRAPAEFSEGR
jgi:amidase